MIMYNSKPIVPCSWVVKFSSLPDSLALATDGVFPSLTSQTASATREGQLESPHHGHN